ncbi:MAG: right-handed parallel beta-helix repeat-containing protein [Candidatus Eisenbacteria bacterium]
MRREVLLFTVTMLIAWHCASARTWYIKPDGTGDVPTISAGEDSAASGDTLLLADGVYTGADNRSTSVYAKAIRIISESGNPEACVINCQYASVTCINIASCSMGGGAGGIIEGIKITRASTAVNASCNASVSVRNCILIDNTGIALKASGSPGMGGYPYVWATDCVFADNPAGAIESGFRCETYGSGCTFWDNGCVLHVSDEGYGSLSGCTIVRNSASAGPVISVGWYARANIETSVIAFNSGNAVDGCCYGATVNIECCDVYGNGGDYVGYIAGENGVNGNFHADPMFCDLIGDDYRVQGISPCLPGNHPDGVDCGHIGAEPEGCGEPATEPTTWGTIKSMYR